MKTRTTLPLHLTPARPVLAQVARLVLWGGCLLALPVTAQVGVSLGLSVPGLSIGIDVPSFPRLQRVPGYPVYYDAQSASNYFFYDGLYWVYQNDGWYQSTWYDGPWQLTPEGSVPLFVLRVPVRYYRQPPSYFQGWQANAAPRWGEYWGPAWQREHQGWDRWDRQRMPAVAPLPTYQRRYSGEQYPREPQRQNELHQQQYQRPAGRTPEVSGPPNGQGHAGVPVPRGQPGNVERRVVPAGAEHAPAMQPQRAPERAPERNPGQGRERAPDRGQDRGAERPGEPPRREDR
jgi:hypothetical protein